MIRLLLAALLTAGAARAETLEGRNAVPGRDAAVTATLTLDPAVGRRVLDVAMTTRGEASPIRAYDTELTKRLHVIAVDAGLASFVHEHAAAPGPDGHFRVTLAFPHPGPWHVYADATPAGLGQQVMRFDVDVGRTRDVVTSLSWSGPLEASDGSYAARFEALALSPDRETTLSLHVLRDGKPAPDMAPFLGVAAHVVLIAEASLDYVHVHPVADGGAAMDMAHMGHAMAMPGASVSPEVGLRVPAVAAGTYVVWVQFDAGGRVHTLRFVARSG